MTSDTRDESAGGDWLRKPAAPPDLRKPDAPSDPRKPAAPPDLRKPDAPSDLRKPDAPPDLRKPDAPPAPAPSNPRRPEPAPEIPPGWSPVQPPPAPGWGPPPAPPSYGPPPLAYPGYGPYVPVPSGPGWGASNWGPPPPPKPGIVPLRPLGVGEVLDGAISAIRAHPKTMLGLSAIVAVVAQLIQVPATWLLLRGSIDTTDGVTTAEEDFAAVAGQSGSIGITVLVTLIATLVLTGILTVVVSRAVLGESVTAGQAWAAARPRLLALIGTTALTFLAIALLFALALAPGATFAAAGLPTGLWVSLVVVGVIAASLGAIYLYVLLALAPPAVVLERQGVVAALRRSRQLVSGAWWRTFGLLLLVNVIAGVLSGILSVPFIVLSFIVTFIQSDGMDPYALLPLIVSGVGTVIAAAITWPFTAAATVLIYVDRRMRREGLDLELQRSAGVSPPAPPVPNQAPPPAGFGFIPGMW